MIKIDYLIRTNRRSISITISPKCELIVKAPNRLPLSQIEKVVQQKQAWITLHLDRMRETAKLNFNILNYYDMMFCGQLYHIVYDDKVKQISLEPNYCVVPKKYEDSVSKRLCIWYKKVALKIISERVEYFATLMQLSPSAIKLTNAKTCWGTCNSKAILSFNWRLVFMPHDIIDYVVVHELSHLVQMNHSKLFWDLVQSVLPDYKTRRENLKKGDYLLSLYRG